MDRSADMAFNRLDEEQQEHGGSRADNSHQMLNQEQITTSLHYIASCETGIFKTEETLLHLNTIELVADNGGWSSAHLGLLIQQLTTLPCTALLSRKILFSLVPSETVPARMLVQLAMWGLGNPSLSKEYVVLPTLKVISLCLQYDCVTEKKELDCLYELFISLLARDKLTNPVAELLMHLTTKKEVTEWRVRAVFRCQAKMGSSYHLDSLVWRYRQLRPDLVPTCAAPVARAATATTVMGKRFHKIWEENVDKSLNKNSEVGVWIGGHLGGNVYKKAKRETLIPGREVLSVISGAKAKKDKRLDLGDMTSIFEVVDNIHTLQLPANILAVLGCKSVVQVLAMDQGLVERFSMTLFHTLRNEFICANAVEVQRDETKRMRRREKLLGYLVMLQETVQQGLPVVGRFLSEYLDTWDGSSHFLQILRLVSQLQITDYKELHDCVVNPLIKHFTSYNMIKQLVLLGFLHILLRSWGAVEFERFTKHRAGIFPLSSVHCENALDSIVQLSTEIGELTLLALSMARERCDSSTLLTSQVLAMYKTSQLVMLEFNVPVRLELPISYLYDALFSHSAGLLAQACEHVILNKKKVFPYLHKALRSTESMKEFGSPDQSLIAEMVTVQSMEELLVATRDILVFVSPGNVNLTTGSLLRQGWSAPLGEEWMRDGLFLSSHPALLPYVLKYLDNLNLNTEDRQQAWLQLSEEQDEEEGWEKNITMGLEGPKIGSKSFYNNQITSKVCVSSSLPPKMGNILELLQCISESLPAVEELVVEYKQKAGLGQTHNNRRKDSDLRSICSQQTVDSGTESMLPVNNGVKKKPQARKIFQSVEEEAFQARSRNSSVSRKPLSRQGTISSSLQQNLSRSNSWSSKENTTSKVGTTEEVLTSGSNLNKRSIRKRKSVEEPIVPGRKRRSEDVNKKKGVLRERNY